VRLRAARRLAGGARRRGPARLPLRRNRARPLLLRQAPHCRVPVPRRALQVQLRGVQRARGALCEPTLVADGHVLARLPAEVGAGEAVSVALRLQ